MKSSVVLLSCCILFCSIGVSLSSTDWAVIVSGGKEEAKLIAQRHGFKFIGQVLHIMRIDLCTSCRLENLKEFITSLLTADIC